MGSNLEMRETVRCNYRDLFDVYINPLHLDNSGLFLGGGHYEPHIEEYFTARVKDKRVLDIGSNIGLYTLLALRFGAKEVFSVDPNASDHHLLSLSLGCNGFIGRSRPVIAAASDSNRVVAFNNPVESSNGEINPQGNLLVSAVRLDEFSDYFGWIDVVIIDVEGHEEHAFSGAEMIMRQRPIVFTEFYPRLLTSQQTDPEYYLQRWFKNGYTVSVLDKQTRLAVLCETSAAVMRMLQKQVEIEGEHTAYLDLLCEP